MANNDSFLKYVAEDIVRKYGSQLAHITVVFPNKRAALFLNDQLVSRAGTPLWTPSYTTISDIFRENSTLQVADDIKLICELYKSFAACTGSDETLDRFYGWGTVLLADFDDIDKSMADARGVLSNLKDIHAYDHVDYLSEHQIETLKAFFHHFSDAHNSQLKEKFYRFWSHFHEIYQDFNHRLSEQGLTYEGALYRAVVTEGSVRLRGEKYLFVGFNALQKVEQRLFSIIRREKDAEFYWDFDRYYTAEGQAEPHEAGVFVKPSLSLFPNALDTEDEKIYDCFRKEKHITFVGAPTDNIQARYVSQWLQREDRVEAGNKTAIVLCDENLLPTVIHCIPENVKQLNITTGFPLMHSAVASLIGRLMELQYYGRTQKDKYRLKFVNAVLRHPYAKYISPMAGELSRRLTDNHRNFPVRDELTQDEGLGMLFQDIDAMGLMSVGGMMADRNLCLTVWMMSLLKRIALEVRLSSMQDPLFQESVYKAYTLLNRLKGLVENDELKVDIVTYQRLLNQLIATTKIPYHGEPAVGLQIMGVLETRNLDFDHLLILSCNEGNMPKGVSDSSFIPYSLKEAFGMTTPEHKVSIYAYYFYRMLQRASDITIMYGNVADEKNTGEVSRFMLQLLVESGHRIDRHVIVSGQLPSVKVYHHIEKTPEVMKRLNSLDYVSPTAINRYIKCQLQFFYNIVAGIKEPEEVEDEIDGRTFGNIFHDAALFIYESIMGVSDERQRQTVERQGFRVEKQHLDNVLRQPALIERALDRAFAIHLFKSDHLQEKPEYNGLQLINRRVIMHYLKMLLEIDRQTAPFIIRGLERDAYGSIRINTSEGDRIVRIGGRIDRLDEVHGEDGGRRIRVIDYKTGSRKPGAMEDVEAVFSSKKLPQHSDYYLQAMLYAVIVRRSKALNPYAEPVSPELLFIQHAGAKDYSPILKINKEPIEDIETYASDFVEQLRAMLSHMMEPTEPFTPTDDRKVCLSCPYKAICGKNEIRE